MSTRAEIKTRLNILRALTGLNFFKNETKAGAISELDILAHKILTAAKKRAPVRTGALRASGRVEKPKPNVRVVGFGGGGTGVNYAGVVEYGAGNQRPQPYLRPAFYAVQATYKKGVIRKTKKAWSIASKIGSS